MIGESTLCWHLDPKQIDWFTQHRHMNRYVYAMYQDYTQADFPYNTDYEASGQITGILLEPVNNLIQTIRTKQSKQKKRIAFSLAAHKLFAHLSRMSSVEELTQVIPVLTLFASPAIKTYCVPAQRGGLTTLVRNLSPEIEQQFQAISPRLHISDFLNLVFQNNELDNIQNPFTVIKIFVHKALTAIITHQENGAASPDVILKKFRHLRRLVEARERKIFDASYHLLWYEHGHSHCQRHYWNSLLLYGGNHLERMGLEEEAFDWYTSGLIHPDVANRFRPFRQVLLNFKVCERLLCAYQLAYRSSSPPKFSLFRQQIEQMTLKSFHFLAEQSIDILKFVARNPDADLTQRRIRVGKKVFTFYDELVYEPFLFTLLYEHIILGGSWGKHDYDRYLSLPANKGPKRDPSPISGSIRPGTKDLWQYAPEELETIYTHRHLNNYAYASALEYHRFEGKPPEAQPVHRLKEVLSASGNIPPNIHRQLLKTIQSLEQRGNPTQRRIQFSIASHQLFHEIGQSIGYKNMETILPLLGGLMFDSVRIDKEDHYPVWPFPVIRELTDEKQRKFDALQPDTDFRSYMKMAPEKRLEQGNMNPFYVAQRFVHDALSVILTIKENAAASNEEILEKFRILEKLVENFDDKIFEAGYNMFWENDGRWAMGDGRWAMDDGRWAMGDGRWAMGDGRWAMGDGPRVIGVSRLYQHYHNSLRLYGGRHMEQMGLMDEAWDWYTRGILDFDMDQRCTFYLIDFKRCERLISGYRVGKWASGLVGMGASGGLLKALILYGLYHGYRQLARHSGEVLKFLEQAPDADLSKRIATSGNASILFGGEYVREPYVIARYYLKEVEGLDYGDAMGDERWAMSDERWAMGDKRWAMGDERWAMEGKRSGSQEVRESGGQGIPSNVYLWDLSPEQLDFVFHKRHINAFVYAGARMAHAGQMPVGKRVTLKTKQVPEPLRHPTKRLLEIVPSLGKGDTTIVRVNATFRSYQLFEALKEISLEDVPATATLLGSLAFVPVFADKNDNYPLWPHKMVRDLNKHIWKKYQLLMEQEDILKMVHAPPLKKYENTQDPSYWLLKYVQSAVLTIITLIENDALKPEEVSEAFFRTRDIMTQYAANHHIASNNNTFKRTQGTLYLYGGNHFERQGDHQTAYEWYTNDLLWIDLPDQFFWYLDDMKLVERLSSAYALLPPSIEKNLLEELIHRCLLKAYRQTATYAKHVLDYLSRHPEADLKQRLFVKENNQRLQFAGEMVSEVYLRSLLYLWKVKGIAPEEMTVHPVLHIES
jgi:hypothetical protein